MKRKLIIPIVLCLFAGLTVFNIGLAHKPASTDTTLDLISVMVKAFDEGEGEPGNPIYCYTKLTGGGVYILRICGEYNPNSIPSTECGNILFGVEPGFGWEYKQCYEKPKKKEPGEE